MTNFEFKPEDFLRPNTYGDAVELQAKWSAARANSLFKKWLKSQPTVFGKSREGDFVDKTPFTWIVRKVSEGDTHRARIINIEELVI